MTNLESEDVYQKGLCVYYYSCAYVGGKLVNGPQFVNGDLLVITLDMDAKTWSITRNGNVAVSGEVSVQQAKACCVVGANGKVTLV